MELRRADLDDAVAVTSVWLRSRAASVPQIPAPVHADDEVLAYFADIVLVEQEVWVAVVEGEVAALLALDGEWLEQLYVDPNHVGTGIGTRLLDHAKHLRPDGLHLWTFEANLGARRFYERHGFVAIGSTTGDNEEGAPDVHYAWRGSPDRGASGAPCAPSAPDEVELQQRSYPRR